MTSCVLDASAVLALGHDEEGADVVADHLEGSAVSAVNWSEVVRHAREQDVSVDDLREALLASGSAVVPFDLRDAEMAAALWSETRRAGLSLADRACIALAARLGVPVFTADRAWTTLDLGVEVVAIR